MKTRREVLVIGASAAVAAALPMEPLLNESCRAAMYSLDRNGQILQAVASIDGASLSCGWGFGVKHFNTAQELADFLQAQP